MEVTRPANFRLLSLLRGDEFHAPVEYSSHHHEEDEPEELHDQPYNNDDVADIAHAFVVTGTGKQSTT